MGKPNPVAVLISDVHYNLQNLELADAAVQQAIKKANELGVTLIVAGDLHDTKANLRGECVNRMLKTFNCIDEAYIMVGNHDRLNEKNPAHALEFLSRADDYHFHRLITEPTNLGGGITLLPYYHDVDELRAVLKTIPVDRILIMHQGIQGSNSGEYFQDKSALTPQDVAGRRIISGHYHARQTIKLPKGGVWDFIGNPFTTTFGEAGDPEKGFQILMDDGSLEFVPTNLRKHVLYEISAKIFANPGSTLVPTWGVGRNDKVWIKVYGAKEELHSITRQYVNKVFPNLADFRLELIPDATTQPTFAHPSSTPDLIDAIIESTIPEIAMSKRLKTTWRTLCE